MHFNSLLYSNVDILFLHVKSQLCIFSLGISNLSPLLMYHPSIQSKNNVLVLTSRLDHDLVHHKCHSSSTENWIGAAIMVDH